MWGPQNFCQIFGKSSAPLCSILNDRSLTWWCCDIAATLRQRDEMNEMTEDWDNE